MTTDSPVLAHRSVLIATLQLDTDAAITCDTCDPACPVLTIECGPLTLTLEAYGPSQGRPPGACDVRRAADLVHACRGYHRALTLAVAATIPVAAGDVEPRDPPRPGSVLAVTLQLGTGASIVCETSDPACPIIGIEHADRVVMIEPAGSDQDRPRTAADVTQAARLLQAAEDFHTALAALAAAAENVGTPSGGSARRGHAPPAITIDVPPTPGTDLRTLTPQLGTRIIHALLREGIQTVEQLAAEDLDELASRTRLIGATSTAAIREALWQHECDSHA